LALSGRGAATVAAACSGAVGESGDKSPHSKRWREIEYPASDGVRADKAVRAPFVAVVQSILLALVVLALLVCSATPLTCEAGEVRYRVVKIIEGSGTTIPEAGGINQKGQVVGSIDVRGHSNFLLWSDGVREDLPLGNARSGLATALNNQGQVTGAFYTGEFVRAIG